MLTLDALTKLVSSDEIDTVIIALTDLQGRLQGKRLTAQYFLDEVAGHGAEACNYLIAVDVEMRTVGGYNISSWERGYGDLRMKPDFATLRRIPWLEKTVMIQCDLETHEHRPPGFATAIGPVGRTWSRVPRRN
jgi:glutamine synthetase